MTELVIEFGCEHLLQTAIDSKVRRKRNDPCLSLTIEGDRPVWFCHHCQWRPLHVVGGQQ
jgi:hypothetical protein